MLEQNSIPVWQLCSYIKNIFDAEELLHGISVFGEVSGFSSIRGNAYFTLKDEMACLPCVFFGYKGMPLDEGEKIIVTGSPNFYCKGGKLSFCATKIQPFGKGELYLKFLMLKQKLEAEGLFDIANKKPLPQNISKIGVVTSLEGAVLQDIINVTTRRNPFIDILIAPSRVQGAGAEKTIINGLKKLDNSDVDVIIVARGGGSAEDLSVFNDETLARAVFACQKPVISAVGHETDFTIIDFVADVRASTPSVAGEFVTKDLTKTVAEYKKNVSNLNFRYSNFLGKKTFQLDSMITLLTKYLDIKLDSFSKSTTTKSQKLDLCIKNYLNLKNINFESKKAIIQKLNPMSVLYRGYAKIESEGRAILSAKDICGDFDVIFKDGKIKAKKVEE